MRVSSLWKVQPCSSPGEIVPRLTLHPGSASAGTSTQVTTCPHKWRPQLLFKSSTQFDSSSEMNSIGELKMKQHNVFSNGHSSTASSVTAGLNFPKAVSPQVNSVQCSQFTSTCGALASLFDECSVKEPTLKISPNKVWQLEKGITCCCSWIKTAFCDGKWADYYKKHQKFCFRSVKLFFLCCVQRWGWI